MENLLIQIYLFVCQTYDTSSATCYQRLSNNREPEFTDQEIISHLQEEYTRLVAPRKKPKGKELTDDEKYYNRLVRRIRQPIESLFNWIEEKTGIQRALSNFGTDSKYFCRPFCLYSCHGPTRQESARGGSE